MTSTRPENRFEERILERYADTLVGAVKGARNVLLAANLIAFLLLSSLFNSYLSWNYSQQERRAQILSLAEQVDAECARTNQTTSCRGDAYRSARGAILEDGPDFAQIPFDDEYKRELSYLSDLDSSDSLIYAARRELLAHINREKEQDALHLPFVNASFAATDRTVIGGLALSLAAFWMMGSLFRQHSVVDKFLVSKGSGKWDICGEFDKDGHRYVLNALETSASYTGGVTRGLANAIGYALYAMPMIAIILCVIYYMGTSIPAGVATVGRVLAEIAFLILTTASWVAALVQEVQTGRKHAIWKRLTDDKSPKT